MVRPPLLYTFSLGAYCANIVSETNDLSKQVSLHGIAELDGHFPSGRSPSPKQLLQAVIGHVCSQYQMAMATCFSGGWDDNSGLRPLHVQTDHSNDLH